MTQHDTYISLFIHPHFKCKKTQKILESNCCGVWYTHFGMRAIKSATLPDEVFSSLHIFSQ